MRGSNKAWVMGLLLVLLPFVAEAAGFGRLTVLSSIGQPLIGEIELTSVTREELGSLSARLASPDAYAAANLQYNPALTGARVTVERRPNGQHYLKVTSTRPVSEPFIDVLVELTWAAGRLSREFTALLDPPGGMPAEAAPPPVPVMAAVPEPQPATAPAPEVQPNAAPPAPSRPIAPAAPMAGAKEYGPIQSGETLGKIARQVMPEGVSLDQMLVALYRHNPDAFIRKNLNLVRTGKTLRIPDREEVAAIAAGEARTEYRTHVADWNSYRQKVAEATPAVAAEGRTTTSGKITTQVEDPAKAGEPKDVVRVSKGASPKGKPGSEVERLRGLEEDLVAREKAIAEANERIVQLEKTLKDLQTLVALKNPGMAGAQQQAQQAATPAPDPAKPEAAAAPAAAKPEAKSQVVSATKSQPAAKAKAAPKPKEPELMDEVLEAATDPLYLGVGVAALLLGGVPLWMARRRRRLG
jgi:pilus assembly protein FimV